MAAEAPAVSASTNKAGFWIRFFAFVIDAILVGIVSNILLGMVDPDPLSPGRSGLNTLINLAYFCYFWSDMGGGQTLGMRVLDLKVVRTDGSALSIGQAVVRYIGLIVSFICLAIGVIWVAFDPDKQGWHDKIASTYVIRTK